MGIGTSIFPTSCEKNLETKKQQEKKIYWKNRARKFQDQRLQRDRQKAQEGEIPDLSTLKFKVLNKFIWFQSEY